MLVLLHIAFTSAALRAFSPLWSMRSSSSPSPRSFPVVSLDFPSRCSASALRCSSHLTRSSFCPVWSGERICLSSSTSSLKNSLHRPEEHRMKQQNHWCCLYFPILDHHRCQQQATGAFQELLYCTEFPPTRFGSPVVS